MVDLQDVAEIIPEFGIKCFPEDCSELFRRAHGSLLRGGEGSVVVFRNKDLLEMAAHPDAGNMPVDLLLARAFAVNVGDERICSIERLLRNLIFTTNPPEHGARRRVIAGSLMPRFIEQVAPLAAHTVTGMINEVAGQGPIDFGAQFAELVTARFWGALFDLTGDEMGIIADRVHAMTPLLYITRTTEELSGANAATGRYLDVMATGVQRALVQGGNELLAAMASRAGAAADNNTDDLAIRIAANIFDGIHTAATAAVNVVYQLMMYPIAFEAVRGEMKLVSSAVAEGLRLSPPLLVTARHALQDFQFKGVPIARGTQIVMLWGAGNRDPAVFENPNVYDLHRDQRNATTFGGGIHICPGRYMARMLVQAVLEGVLAPNIRIEFAGDGPSWFERSAMRQLAGMSVKIARQ
jgi:cytochrome P450